MGERHVREAVGIQNLPRLVITRQCRVELHVGVDVLFLQHVAADGLDLGRRTAVHRTDGHVVHDMGVDRPDEALELLVQAVPGGPLEQVALLDELVQLVEVLLPALILAGVQHGVDVLLHLLGLDPFQRVADGHVEDEVRFLCLAAMHELVEQETDDIGLGVLVPGLGERELRGPLDVVAFVRGVDAGLLHGARSGEIVLFLAGLQLDETAAGQVARDDVLGQLRMGTGSRAERGRGVAAEHGQLRVSVILIERSVRDLENGSMKLQLLDHPIQQFPERNGMHDI